MPVLSSSMQVVYFRAKNKADVFGPVDPLALAGGSPIRIPVAPVAYQVIRESGIYICQNRESEPLRVHVRIDSWGLFLWTN